MKVSNTHKTREDCKMNPRHSALISHKAHLVPPTLVLDCLQQILDVISFYLQIVHYVSVERKDSLKRKFTFPQHVMIFSVWIKIKVRSSIATGWHATCISFNLQVPQLKSVSLSVCLTFFSTLALSFILSLSLITTYSWKKLNGLPCSISSYQTSADDIILELFNVFLQGPYFLLMEIYPLDHI